MKDADGNPIAEAYVVVHDGGNPIVIQNGEFHYRSNFFVRTDGQGHYALPPQEEDYAILVVHPKWGYFITSWNQLQGTSDVRLLQWGRLELATTGNENSPLRYYVRPVLERENMNARIRFDSTPVQRADGLLIFEGLPVGPVRLGEFYQPMDKGPVIEIESGRTSCLDLRSGKRSVIGQILLPAEGISTEEPLVHLRLRRTEPFSESTYRIDAQGRFRIDGVEPGDHQLVALFFRQLPRGPNAKPDVVGFAVKPFVLPEGEGDFDLGTVPLSPPDELRIDSREG